ncbi:hypothetical protein ABT001_02080 [Streptomyces sp. NPDC002793]|uniref:hypothetical protein n=1 Tax=Streptomyces sp. NPDC002793 TaxID=3154432 RepID=UPI00331D3F9C
MRVRTVDVEEELLLVDARSHEPELRLQAPTPASAGPSALGGSEHRRTDRAWL